MNRPEILLCPQVPKPLHGLNPRSVLGQEWWDIERRKAYAKADYKCQACGVPKSLAKYHQWLEAHELYCYDYAEGKGEMLELVALCHSCHNYIHDGRMAMTVNEMGEDKVLDILRHGDKVLSSYLSSNGFLFSPGYKQSESYGALGTIQMCARLGLPYVKNVDKSCDWNKWRLVINGSEYKTRFESIEDWYFYYNGKSMPRRSHFGLDMLDMFDEFDLFW